MAFEGPGQILGGLPVIAVISITHGDGWTSDDDFDIESIHWMKKDGSKGKEIPQHIRDRAEEYDFLFCNLYEQVHEHVCHEQWLKEEAEKGNHYDDQGNLVKSGGSGGSGDRGECEIVARHLDGDGPTG